MTKITFFIALICTAFNLKAQQLPDWYQPTAQLQETESRSGERFLLSKYQINNSIGAPLSSMIIDTFIYDANNQNTLQTQTHEQFWPSAQYYRTQKRFFYDNNGLMIWRGYYLQDSTGGYYLNRKDTLIYNTENQLIIDSTSMYALANQSFYGFNTEKYEYFSNGSVSKQTTSTYNSATMTVEPKQRFTYSYLSNGKIFEKVFKVYNANTTFWDSKSKNQYAYNAAGNQIKNTYFSFDNAWAAAFVNEQTYDSLDRLDEAFFYIYGNLDRKVKCTYDQYGRLDKYEYFDYSGNNLWSQTHLYDYFYDEISQDDDIYLPFYQPEFPGIAYDRKVSEEHIYVISNGGFLPYSKEYLTWIPASEPSATDQAVLTADINIFPNPANDHLRIQANPYAGACTFELYNQLGQKVFSTALNGAPETVLTSHLAPGIYAYRLSNSNSVFQTGKILIAR